VTEPGLVALDLDGVLWRGDDPIPGSAAAMAALRAAGLRVAFLTNNSSVRPVDVVAKLASHGVVAAVAEVLTSAQVAAELLCEGLPPGARVLACAGAGVVDAVVEAGFAVVRRAPADAVVVGFHRDFDFDGLDRASAAVRAGARFVATNLDPTYPAAGGVLPGAGSIAAAVATAAGRSPEVAGKPEAPTVAAVRRRFGDRGVMVGDRPSTDGVLATRLGWPFALVLSGIGGHDPAEPVPEPPPEFVGADLARVVPDVLAHLGIDGRPG
jgi:HAD superfamily hydrolase (TIGR01450 family)